jgi:peptide deformylase
MNPDKYLRKHGDPVLRTVCAPVEPGEPLPFMLTMEKVCKKTKTGVGLAAPQIGVTKRVIFLNCADAKGTVRGRFMINPVIVAASQEQNVKSEGCLSFPGVFKNIARPDWIEVEYLDERRRPRKERAHGFPARVICHEVDHLDGVCKVGDPDYPDDGETTAKRNAPRLAAAIMACAALGA